MVGGGCGGEADHQVDVGKLGLDEAGLEPCHVLQTSVHEDDVDNVVAYVSLSLNLELDMTLSLKMLGQIKKESLMIVSREIYDNKRLYLPSR